MNTAAMARAELARLEKSEMTASGCERILTDSSTTEPKDLAGHVLQRQPRELPPLAQSQSFSVAGVVLAGALCLGWVALGEPLSFCPAFSRAFPVAVTAL